MLLRDLDNYRAGDLIILLRTAQKLRSKEYSKARENFLQIAQELIEKTLEDELHPQRRLLTSKSKVLLLQSISYHYRREKPEH